MLLPLLRRKCLLNVHPLKMGSLSFSSKLHSVSLPSTCKTHTMSLLSSRTALGDSLISVDCWLNFSFNDIFTWCEADLSHAQLVHPGTVELGLGKAAHFKCNKTFFFCSNQAITATLDCSNENVLFLWSLKKAFFFVLFTQHLKLFWYYLYRIDFIT